jgi:hypothetical protein
LILRCAGSEKPANPQVKSTIASIQRTPLQIQPRLESVAVSMKSFPVDERRLVLVETTSTRSDM